MDMARVLADMALELEKQRSTDDALGVVSEYACRVTGADDAGILLLSGRKDDTSFGTPAATSERVDEAHRLQVALGEGPCLDAIDGRATYVTSDVTHDARWPRWGPVAAGLGIRATAGVRLATRDRGYGSLNIYSNSAAYFDALETGLIEVLAAHATAAIAAAARAEGLQTALETRTVIGQAQGILMAKFDVDADTAFAFLKRVSQHENLKLHAIAEAIVTQRDANARPERDPAEERARRGR